MIYIENKQKYSKAITDYPLHQAVIERKLFKIHQLCIGDDPDYFYTDINKVDYLGNTPLMLAVKLRYYEEVLVLIDHGADPKYRLEKSHPSPLEQAIGLNDKSLIRILIGGYHRIINLE